MFPATEPYDSGLLDVGDGHDVYWECCGKPDWRPLVFLRPARDVLGALGSTSIS
jgi:hypothetical protein